MVRIAIDYLGDLRCRAVHTASGASLETAAPLDNGGKGDSFSPTDLAATALGTCVATVLGLHAARHSIDLRGMRVTVDKHMTATGPRRIARLDVVVELPLPRDSASDALERAARTCPVQRSLLPGIEIRLRFVWRA
mgnify:CR=1 FL=1